MERPLPDAPWYNNALLTEEQWREAVEQVRRLKLPLHRDPYKNWDHLAAIDVILKRTDHSASVLHAGAVVGSKILPWLERYGYTHLVGINPKFDKPINKGEVLYTKGDISRTSFPDNSFDAITCMSVIEHGVDALSYFSETSRILKPGGYLITSTDYFSEPVQTFSKRAFGIPIHIFDEQDIQAMLKLAAKHNFNETGPVQLHCQDKPIRWRGLEYTFLIFTLQKGK